MTTPPPQGRQQQRYIHEALFFDTDENLLGEGLDFVSEGLRRGEDVALVCSADRNQLLHETLNGGGDLTGGRLTLIDQREAYRHATGALDFFQRLALRSASDGIPRARVFAEVPFGNDQGRWAEWRRFEALCNVALAELRMWSVCAYDTRSTTPELDEIVRKTHPILHNNGQRGDNAEFVDPVAFLEAEPEADALPVERQPPIVLIPDIRSAEELRDARQRLHQALASVPGLATPRARDFLLGANELLENALVHGTPPVSVRLWIDQTALVCSVTDQGAGFRNPFAGYWRRLDVDLERHGLWLARQLCDEVSFHRRPAFTARARLTLP